MTRGFDGEVVASKGWRQGAILGQRLASRAWEHAPERIDRCDISRLLVTTHDCDILNRDINKEPVIELLRARIADSGGGASGLISSGRNPRRLRLPHVQMQGSNAVLDMDVHDRWPIPRELLMEGGPAGFLNRKDCRLVAEWLAKRYIRAAFPNAFDYRWRRESKAWRKLLVRYSSWIKGVYIRLNSQRDLPDDEPYRCGLLVAVSDSKKSDPKWPEVKDEIERAITDFWNRLRPAIECETCDVLTTNMVTLADVEVHLRFDADWVSFEDESDVVPISTDFRH